VNMAEKIFDQRFMHLTRRVEAASGSGRMNDAWRGKTPDPDALIERWLRDFAFKPDVAIALAGLGDGTHVDRLLSKLPKEAMVFCAEPDVDRFKAFLQSSLAPVLLEDARFYVGAGELDDAFYRSLASFDVMDFTDAQPLVFAPVFNEHEAYYSEFFLQFARQLEMWRKMYGTNLTQSGAWQRNSIVNLEKLAATPDPLAFQGAFEGVPMIMAGAGPSLAESLDFIKSVEGKAVIVAGNSSIRALRRAGIDPHFVLAADPNPATDAGFEGVELGRSILFCPFMVFPGVPKRFGSRVSAWAYGNNLASYFTEQAGRKRLAFVAEQGTVSACAFDLAVILGCPAIFFVGQDFAATIAGKLHNSDSFYTDWGADEVDTQTCRWLPGNTLEKVPVEAKLYVYLKTFEELSYAYTKELEKNLGKGLSLYNLSRLGARVRGMPYLSFGQAAGVLDSHRSADAAAGWRRAEEILARFEVGMQTVEAGMASLSRYAEDTCKLALEGATKIELEKIGLSEARLCKERLDHQLASEPRWEWILMDGQLKFELHVSRRAAHLMRRGGAYDELEDIKSNLWAVAEGCYHLLSSIDMAKDGKLAPESGG